MHGSLLFKWQRVPSCLSQRHLLRNISTSIPHRAAQNPGYVEPGSPEPTPLPKPSTPRHLTLAQHKVIDQMLRVDQAGEVGANYIYRGQMLVLGSNRKLRPLLQHMWDQEKVHLTTMDKLITQHRVRPSLLRPVWEVAGMALGVGTALLGKEAAMACTEAVETVIGEHYDDQIRELVKMGDTEGVKELTEWIAKFRDEELEHLDIAVDHDAQKAPLHRLLSGVISTGCKAAIWVAGKV